MHILPLLRRETQGGIYHIMNRGNMCIQVFDNEGDYEYFFDFIKDRT
jgi:putative transposase